MATESPQPLVPIEDMAKHINVSVSTIRNWVRTGVIPAHTYLKFGNVYRFNIPDVVTALTSAPKEPEPAQLELNLDPKN